jgi:hypothetical protein
MTYEEYKKKHDWYDNSVVTLEKQLADGQGRLDVTKGELTTARDECNLASDACLKKPSTEVTPEEWARLEAADKRVGELDAKRQGIEDQNGRTSAGLDTARQLRGELEAEHPAFKERNIAELESAMQKPTSDDPGLGKAGTGFQAYAGIAAVVVTMDASSPTLPSDGESVRALDPAAIAKAEAGSLSFESMPSSVRDRMRADSQPLRDSIVEQHPPPPPNETLPYSVGASNDPRLSYSVSVPPPGDTVGASPPAASAPDGPQPSGPAPSATMPSPSEAVPAKTNESSVPPPSDGMNM